MTIRVWAGAMAAAVALASAGGVRAMTPGELVTACNAESGFGFAFGAPPAPAAEFLDNTVYFVPVNPAFAPFSQAELQYSRQSPRLEAVATTAEYDSDEAAERVLAGLVAAVKADGRFPIIKDEPSDVQVEGQTPSYLFSTEWGADKASASLSFLIFRIGPEVHLQCAIQAASQEESSGQAPSSL